MKAKCILCGKGKLELFDSRNNQLFYICNKCHVITSGKFLNDDIQKTNSIEFYKKNLDLEAVDKAIFENNTLFLSLSKYMDNIDKKTILDFGCGNGYFLHAAKRQGFMRAIGIDVNINEAQRINEHFGNEIEFYPHCAMLGRHIKIDYVLFWHVLEHLVNPNIYLRILKPYLNKGAILFIQVPQYKKEYVVPSHYWFFSISAMQLLMQKNGFSIIKYEFDVNNEFFQVIAKYE